VQRDGKGVTIFHLGDYDPSGHAAADAIERTFRDTFDWSVNFERIAILPEQIEQFSLPTRLLNLGNATAGSEVGGAANQAKKLGADAIILLSHGSSYPGTYSTGSATAYRTGDSATAYGTAISIPIMRGKASSCSFRWGAPRSSPPQSHR